MKQARRALFHSLAAGYLLLGMASMAYAQDFPSCVLGQITERVAPQYPIALGGRVTEGTVQVQANFAPDGRVSSSKVISGPAALRFEAEAYVRGWRAEKREEPRACVIAIQYRFDGSQGVCGPHNEVHIRAERQDETHVLMRLSCDIW